MLKLKNTSRRLAIKYAGFPVTMPSEPGSDLSNPVFPKSPRVPVIEEIPYSEPYDLRSEPESDIEVKTPRLDVSPIEREMLNEESSGSKDTVRPETLAQMSKFQSKLIQSLESMYLNNLIGATFKQGKIQEVQRAMHDADLFGLHKMIKKIVQDAEIHAINYAKKMKSILNSLD